ncbi:MAG: HAMP domain-containing protein [Elusimicrobia bacterium]|nr:HAMP domain-containing protein [Elusimicrobiota bacterium]
MKKIGLRLTFAVIVTALITKGVFAFFSIRAERDSLLAEVERHADQLSETVKLDTEYDMMLNHRDRIRESITRIGTQPGIQRIRVMNKGGSIIYSSEASEVGKTVDKKAESCYKCHSAANPLERLEKKERSRVFRPRPESPRLLGIINPIYNAPSCATAACHEHPRSQVVLGVLDVTLSLAEIDRAIRRGQVRIIIFAGVAVLALSLIVGVLVRRWVDVPVKALLKATQEVAGGNLGYVIGSRGDDELWTLAASFNVMTQKLAEARMQLFQSDKLASLGRLAAGVAHEINNPLTAVLTYSSFLAKRSQGSPETTEDLNVIVRETIRCREIVKSLLDFARQSVPRKAETGVNEIIDRAVAVAVNQLNLNHVQLVKELDRALPKAVLDANQLQQVFINLIVNAADAIGPGGGVITLSSRSLTLSAAGTVQIKKAVCPKRHSLIDEQVRIGGKPAVCLKAVQEGREALVYVDPMYGVRTHRHGLPGAGAAKTQFSCPQCQSPLDAQGRACPDCGGAVYSFEVPGKGMLDGCANRDCGWQRWAEVDSVGPRLFIEVKVRDTGCGIPKERIPLLFEPFSSTKGQQGTGLGLAVTWGIVDNHDGTITVESSEGAGATFTVRLPAKP